MLSRMKNGKKVEVGLIEHASLPRTFATETIGAPFPSHRLFPPEWFPFWWDRPPLRAASFLFRFSRTLFRNPSTPFRMVFWGHPLRLANHLSAPSPTETSRCCLCSASAKQTAKNQKSSLTINYKITAIYYQAIFSSLPLHYLLAH